MIGTDYHLHTHYVGCADGTMTIPAILDRTRTLGRTSIAITDHRDRDVQIGQNRQIRAELERTDPGGLEVFFGCEVNVQDLDGSVALSPEQKRDEGFEIVVGGVHSTWFKDGEATVEQIIERQVELMCKAAANPIVDVLVHPWWFPGHEFKSQLEGRFTSMTMVPDDLTCKLAEVCLQNDTAVELNTSAILEYPLTGAGFKASYAGYIARFVELGCKVALSSDGHRIDWMDSIMLGEKMLEEIGVPESQVWRPEVKAAVVGARLQGQGQERESGRDL